MKALYCKSAILLLILVATGLSLNAQALREEQSKDFDVTGSTELTVENQFGNITVTDWDQNKLSVTYIIEVTNADEAKAKKVMEKIKIDITEEGGKIKFKTNLGEQGNLNLHNNKNEKQSFRIDYFVKCPKSLKMTLENQFGDMILGSLTGSFSADLQFGSLKAVSLAGSANKIDMQFGEVNIGSLKNAKIDIQHCELLKIGDAGTLELNAQFTEVELGNVANLKAAVNSCKISIEGIGESLKLDSNMGNTKVENVAAGFKSLSIEHNMGDITLGMDPKAGYTLTAEANMGSVKVPEGFKRTNKKDAEIPGVTIDKVTGTFGDGASIVKIKANLGSVRLK